MRITYLFMPCEVLVKAIHLQSVTVAKRFCALMNMPPPPQPTAYRAYNIAVAKAAKTVAVKSMKDAANGLRNNQLKKVNQCAVSCDGIWQRRGHSCHEWVCDDSINGEWEVP